MKTSPEVLGRYICFADTSTFMDQKLLVYGDVLAILTVLEFVFDNSCLNCSGKVMALVVI